jgi:hypothetical protein
MSNFKDLVDDYVESEGVDQNESTSTGTGFAPPPEGRGFARVVEYVEIGQHFGMYQGKPKAKPDNLVRITLELSGKLYPPIVAEDGTEYPQRLSLELNLSTNDKSRFYKLFRALNAMAGDKYKHFAQLAVDNFAFVVTIHHNASKKDAAVKYANIWKDGAWQVAVAGSYDEEENFVPSNVKPALTPTRIFLYNKPTPDTWASLFVEGTRDDGSSKNWIQERILNSVNYPNSQLEAMLNELPDAVAAQEAKAESEPKAAKAKAPAKASAKADALGEI